MSPLDVLPSVRKMARYYAQTVRGLDADDLEGEGMLAVCRRQKDYDPELGGWRQFACRVARSAIRNAVIAQADIAAHTVLLEALSTSDTMRMLAGTAATWCLAPGQEEAAIVDEVIRKLEAPERGRRIFAATVLYGAVSCEVLAKTPEFRRDPSRLRRARIIARRSAASILDS